MGRPPLLSRVAARARRALGMDELSQRLDDIETGLATLHADRYPNGPLYFGDHTALVATRWGAKMLVDTRDAAIAPWIVLDGLWETHVTDWLQQTLRPGQMFVDVGANVGYFTLLGAQLVGPKGRVVAVEAHPGLAELLRRNVIMNGLYGYVTTWHRAAWSTRRACSSTNVSTSRAPRASAPSGRRRSTASGTPRRWSRCKPSPSTTSSMVCPPSTS